MHLIQFKYLFSDRNSAPDADEKFRWLAGIYEILKEPEKRATYDKVLVEGKDN